MRIRTRLIFVLAVLAAVIFTVTVTAVTAFSRLGQAVATTVAENLRSIEAAHAMRQAIDRQDRGFLLILAGQGGRGRETVAAGAAAFQEQLDVARNNLTVEGEGELVAAIGKAYERYRAATQPFHLPPPPPEPAASSPPAPPLAPPPAPPAALPEGAASVAPGQPGGSAGFPAAAGPPTTLFGTPRAPAAAPPILPADSDPGVARAPGASGAGLLAGLPFDVSTYFRLADSSLEDVHQALDNLASLNRYAIDLASKEAALHGWRRSAWVVAVGLLGVALAVFFGRRLYRSIAAPLEAIESGIGAIRRGDYGRRIGLDSHDELGQIAAAINAAADQFARLDAAREGRARLYERLASVVLDAFEPNALIADRRGEPLVVGRKARERLGPNPVQALRDGAGGLIPPGEIDERIQAAFERRESRLPPPPAGERAGVEVRPVFGRAGSVIGAAILLPPA